MQAVESRPDDLEEPAEDVDGVARMRIVVAEAHIAASTAWATVTTARAEAAAAALAARDANYLKEVGVIRGNNDPDWTTAMARDREAPAGADRCARGGLGSGRRRESRRSGTGSSPQGRRPPPPAPMGL